MSAIERALKDIDEHPNSIVAWVLIASYLYYHRFNSIFKDEEFDELCAFLVEHWDSVTHPLKRLITLDDMKAGTLYALKLEEYPMGLIRIAERILRELSMESARNG